MFAPLSVSTVNNFGLGPAALYSEHLDPFADHTESEGIRTLPIPGVRCATCAANGEEVWVTPGLICAKCRTPAPSQALSTNSYYEYEDCR